MCDVCVCVCVCLCVCVSLTQVWSVSKEQLQRQLGHKTGLALWSYAHNRDDRPVEPPKARKSVGAEVNWGIRFTGECTRVIGKPMA